MSTALELRRGVYRDSVRLMQVSAALAQRAGVEAALVSMATPLNLDLLPGLGFDPSLLKDATSNDLLVAVRARDEPALSSAVEELDRLLSAPEARDGAGGFGEPPVARTTGRAVRQSGAPLALVSVPGPNAFVEAMDALRGGASVMVFSDNVPLDQEVALKEEAGRRGLLVMGPDCGTAIVGGVGLGFANVVRPGPVGVVAASGTGAQQLCALLDAAGVGVSAVLGTGGRDLSREVGARSTLRALELLDEHAETELAVVISKPPAGEIAARVRESVSRMRKPALVGFLGRGQPDLTAVATAALERLGRPSCQFPEWHPPRHRLPRRGALRGLFSGGSLCDEAMAIAAEALGPIASNIPLDPAWELPPSMRSTGHLMIDFGDDSLTRGRPHPMIDWSLRLERLAVEAADPGCAVVLLDVVLGWGAHPAPAAVLAPAIHQARERAAETARDLAVVVSLTGTVGDPQGLEATASALQQAGASVHLSNAAAARTAVSLAGEGAV